MSAQSEATASLRSRPFGMWFIVAVLACVVLNPLNSSTISVALPKLLAQFHTGTAGITWIVSGYYLGSAVAQPLMGKLGDQWGRALFIYAGLALMIITALLAPLSTSLPVFVFWRVVQAVGTSMVYPNAIGLVRQYRPGDLGRVLGWISMAAGIAVAIGPTLGGFLVDWLSWHAIFWLNIPLSAVAAVLLWFLLPRGNRPAAPPATQGAALQMDWFGIVLFAGSITAWLYGVTTRPVTRLDWLVFAVALVLTIVLIWVEHRQRAPVIPVRWFAHRQFAFGSLITFLANLIMYCILYGLPTFLETVRRMSATESGLFLLMFAGVMTLTSPLGGYFAQGSQRKYPLLLSGVLLLLGTAVIWLGITSPLWILAIGLALCGVSFSISNIVIQQMYIESVPENNAGQASGVYTMVRYVGTIASSAFVSGTITSAAGAGSLFLMLTAGSLVSVLLMLGVRDHT